MDGDSVVGVAIRCGLDGPGFERHWKKKFSAPVQTGAGSRPVSYAVGAGWFPGVKGPGRGVNQPPVCIPKGKERAEPYF